VLERYSDLVTIRAMGEGFTWDTQDRQRDIAAAKAVMAGTWKSQGIWGGIKEGMIKLAPYGPAVPADVRALADAKGKEIASGKLHPFQGPVKDQSGKVRIPAGQTMSDKDMLGFKWYVEGVIGELPK